MSIHTIVNYIIENTLGLEDEEIFAIEKFRDMSAKELQELREFILSISEVLWTSFVKEESRNIVKADQ